MAHIEIPFRADMRQAIIDGHKSCTSRNKRYGGRGDTFAIEGRTYRLTSVRKRCLGSVATFLYDREGTDSPAEFAALWAEIHPGKGFDSFQQVWVHHFEEMTESLSPGCDGCHDYDGHSICHYADRLVCLKERPECWQGGA